MNNKQLGIDDPKLELTQPLQIKSELETMDSQRTHVQSQRAELMKMGSSDQWSSSFLKPSLKKGKIKWVVLIFILLSQQGLYYTFNLPQPIEKHLEQQLGINKERYSLLFSAYNFPNVFITLIGGYLVDKYTARKCLLFFLGLIFIGQTTFLIGCQTSSFPLLVLARFINGLGGDNIIVAEMSLIKSWFKFGGLALACGLNSGQKRLGNLMNSLITPYFTQKTGSTLTSNIIAATICLIAWLMAIILFFFDREMDVRENKLLESEGFGDDHKKKEDAEKKMNPIQFWFYSIKQLKITYWYLTFIFVLTLSSFLTFSFYLGGLIQEMFTYQSNGVVTAFNQALAGRYIASMYFPPTILSPVFGWIFDRLAKRNSQKVGTISFAHLLFTISFILILTFPSTLSSQYLLLIPLILISIFFSLYATSMWPALTLDIGGGDKVHKETKNFGQAIGLTLCLMNISLVINPFIFGFINDHTQKYRGGWQWSLLYLQFLVCIAFIITLLYQYAYYKQNKKYEEEKKKFLASQQ